MPVAQCLLVLTSDGHQLVIGGQGKASHSDIACQCPYFGSLQAGCCSVLMTCTGFLVFCAVELPRACTTLTGVALTQQRLCALAQLRNTCAMRLCCHSSLGSCSLMGQPSAEITALLPTHLHGASHRCCVHSCHLMSGTKLWCARSCQCYRSASSRYVAR